MNRIVIGAEYQWHSGGKVFTVTGINQRQEVEYRFRDGSTACCSIETFTRVIDRRALVGSFERVKALPVSQRSNLQPVESVSDVA